MRDWHERRVLSLSLVIHPRETTKVGDMYMYFMPQEDSSNERLISRKTHQTNQALRSYIQWSSKHSTLYLTVLLGACRAIDMPYRYMCTDSGGPLISPDTGFPLKRHSSHSQCLCGNVELNRVGNLK
jgi:hypothetical protein